MFIIIVCLLNPTKCATKVEMSQDSTLGGQTPLCVDLQMHSHCFL